MVFPRCFTVVRYGRFPQRLTLKPPRVVLFVLQAVYIWHLFSSKLDHVNSACAVGSHFIANNLLHAGFVALFVDSHFVWAEVVLLVNFVNLSALYFRHHSYPRFIHTPAVSGPLAWTFVAIYWNGAIMVPHPASLIARIFANIFVWGILVYGGFFLYVYSVSFDYFPRSHLPSLPLSFFPVWGVPR